MQASARGVDFLIVTALPGEFEAVRMLLVEQEPFAHGIVAKIGREGSTAKYTVALTEIGGMGTNEAQAVAGRVLNYCTPARVILTGITAGFPELNVKEGDILVPYGVVPYELAKITEKSVRIRWWPRFRRGPGKRLGYEHRGIAIAVSHGLWHAANSLGEDANTNWPGAIRESRPDGTCDRPKVHSAGFSILGSGEKIVGSEFAEARLWLREQFPRQAIGLEMESYGVLKACHVTDTPFLVIKASQDPATAQKDETGEKDKWRKYAMEAAAAFTTALIRRFELESFALVLEHIKQVQELARDYERIAPKPVFTYTVSRAASYSLLKEGIYDSKNEALTALIPGAATQQIALHGGGGTGKTRIVRLLLNPMLDADLCPLILDLKEYSIRGKYVQGAVSRELFLADMLQVASKPPRTLRELEHLANQASLVVLVDGLNEISREARTALISYLKSLNCYLLTTDRLGTAESLEGFCPLTVDNLDRSTVQSVLYRDLGVNFDDLDKDLQPIYQRPFFLNLAVKAKGKFTGTRVWSGIFEEFFRNHLHLTHEKLDEVARATLTAHMPGIFDLCIFKGIVQEEMYQSLVDAEVLRRDGSTFDHHLWRDYLFSRRLAQDDREWNDPVFDIVTTFSSSLECLSLTVEQLNREQKDRFLKKIFDWSYLAAAECISEFRAEDPGPRQLSPEIRSAILAAVAEKSFDPVQRTRQRATQALSYHRYQLAQPFREAASRAQLVQHVGTLIETEEGWFKQWKELFTRPADGPFSAQDADLVASGDSIIGWTAANLARRSVLDESRQERLRTIYEMATGFDETKSIRWRVVHAVGAHPSAKNVEFLLRALKDDSYHWARYGAVRSLIEMAAYSADELRGAALCGLRKFLEDYNPSELWERRQVLREIIEAAFIRKPEPSWKGTVLPILELAAARVDPEYKDVLRGSVSKFPSYSEE